MRARKPCARHLLRSKSCSPGALAWITRKYRNAYMGYSRIWTPQGLAIVLVLKAKDHPRNGACPSSRAVPPELRTPHAHWSVDHFSLRGQGCLQSRCRGDRRDSPMRKCPIPLGSHRRLPLRPYGGSGGFLERKYL